MNKSAIRNFAVGARAQLIEAAKQRAYEYEITEKGENKANLDAVAGRLLTSDEKQQRQQLIEQIRRKGYTQVMEEAAYTWFNRFIALRFMEVNGFLPSKVRVFTDENGNFKPEILKEAMTVEIDGLDRGIVLDLLDKQNNEQLYKYLLITQCNALNQGLPYMFEKISNWTELLFPANLLRPDSVIGQMVSEIPEEDWQDAVQIIGWMYQYYNSELKDDTFALLKKNVKITKERIPAATQLFTPDWIVRYMVENSLGRLYINDQLSVGSYQSEAERVAAEKALAEKMGWKYYLPEAEQEPEVRKQLNALTTNHLELTTLKIIDPCMGSGHILVYAFDVLLQIYTSCGWSERDAAKSIVENNLYGLDIDDRAGQLAYFAVMMKARKYSRRILNGEVRPNVLAIQDSGFMTDDFIAYVAGKDAHMKADLTLLRSSLKDAKEYGSILNIPRLNFTALYERMDIISREFAEDIFQIAFQTITAEQLLPLVKQAEIMAQKYDVVVTNPPYMGGSGMSNKLTEFVKKNYPDSKSDLFAVFIEKANQLLKQNGYQALITMESWMFLTSFEKLRAKIIFGSTIVNMVHMPYLGKGGTSLGINFGTAAFVLQNRKEVGYRAQYEYTVYYECNDDGVPLVFPTKNERWKITKQSDFVKIPGAPIAYWVSEQVVAAFKNGILLGDIADSKQGVATADNNRFLRMWQEVDISKVCLSAKSQEEAVESRKKWFPYNKGGDFRRWYGNNDYLVNWENDGAELRSFKGAVLRNPSYYFQPCFSWSLITTGTTAFRYKPHGFIFDVGGMSCFTTSNLMYLLALCNTKVIYNLLKIVAPTINCQCGDVARLPVFTAADSTREDIEKTAVECVNLTRTDWDQYEISWDFKKHPLI